MNGIATLYTARQLCEEAAGIKQAKDDAAKAKEDAAILDSLLDDSDSDSN
jgi:hypothetical protein